MFSGTAVRDKNPYEIAQFGTNDTGFGTVDHYLHRKRRRALNPFFSMASIDRLEPIMRTLIEKLCARIDEAQTSRMPLNMRLVYLCYTTDFITTYALNSSWNHLDSPDFSPLWCRTIKETGAMSKWTKQFPFLYSFLASMPDWLVGKINPGMIMVLDMQRVSARYRIWMCTLILARKSRVWYKISTMPRSAKKTSLLKEVHAPSFKRMFSQVLSI